MTVTRQRARPAVTVAIVAYQSGSYLQPCLDAVALQTLGDFECVVADNASTDGSIEGLRLPDERFRVEAMGANLGFAAANNWIARRASTIWLATLNPDAVPDRTWLEELLAAADRWPQAKSVGSTQLSLENPTRLDGVGDVWHAGGVAWRARQGRPSALVPDEAETFAACAAAALYELDAFHALGGFDETFFCYSEDVDLAFRLRLAGHVVVQASAAVVKHGGSAISGRTSDFTIFYGHRNRIWTFAKNTPGALLWLLIPYHVVMNVILLLLLLRSRTPWPLLRAYAAALRGLPALWPERRRVQRARKVGVGALARTMAWSPLAILRGDVLGGRLPFRRKAVQRLEAELRAKGEEASATT